MIPTEILKALDRLSELNHINQEIMDKLTALVDLHTEMAERLIEINKKVLSDLNEKC